MLYSKINICNTPNGYATRPIAYIKTNWDSWDEGIIQKDISVEGPRYFITGYKNTKWGSVILLSYYLERPIYLRVDNGEWKTSLWL